MPQDVCSVTPVISASKVHVPQGLSTGCAAGTADYHDFMLCAGT